MSYRMIVSLANKKIYNIAPREKVNVTFFSFLLKFSCIMLKNGQAYFRNLAVWAPQDF